MEQRHQQDGARCERCGGSDWWWCGLRVPSATKPFRVGNSISRDYLLRCTRCGWKIVVAELPDGVQTTKPAHLPFPMGEDEQRE